MNYNPDLTLAVRRSLYRLRWKLGNAWGDRVVLVGGLVPPHGMEEPHGAVALADAVRSSAIHAHPFILESFRTLRSLFESFTSPGPVGYARTLGGDTAQREQHRRYANGIVLEFLDAVELGG